MGGALKDNGWVVARTPRPRRSWTCFGLFCALLLTSQAIAQPSPEREVLTEARVVALVRARTKSIVAARMEAERLSAEGKGESRYPNPSVGWNREHMTGTGPLAGRQDDFLITIPIELSGARSAHGAMAEAEALRAKADAALHTSEVIEYALSLYYEQAARQEIRRIDEGAVARFAEAARVVASRKAEGVASGRDLLRLELEAGLARSKMADAERFLELGRMDLGYRLGLGADGFAVPPLLSRDQDVEFGSAKSPTGSSSKPSSARALDAAVAVGKDAEDSADWAWFPGISVVGGPRVGFLGGTQYGYVIGATVELPLFARGQDLDDEARAVARATEATRDQRGLELDRSLALAEKNWRSIHAELQRFTAEVSERVAQLERASLSAYREGSSGIAELVDSERTRVEIQKRTVELALELKRAEIRWRAARGEFE
jgi:outer membrane protein TolC